MKLKLTYIPEEENRAAAVLAALLRRFPGARVRRSHRHPPFKHIYLSIKEGDGECAKESNCFPKIPTAAREILDKTAPQVVQ